MFGLCVMIAFAAVSWAGAFAAEPPSGKKSGNGAVEYCADGEHSVFYGSTEGWTVAVCIPDEIPPGGYYLSFYLKHPDGQVTRLREKIADSPEFAVGGSVGLSGGGYAFIQLNDGGRRYTVYAGIGRFVQGSQEPVPVAGLVIEDEGVMVENLDMVADHESELGPELFTNIGLRTDDELFVLPLDDPEYAMDSLFRALQPEIQAINDNGGNAALVENGFDKVDGVVYRLFSLGEDSEEKFTALEHYAISPSGRMFRMDILDGGQYVPMDALANWPGSYRNGDVHLRVEPSHSEPRSRFDFSFRLAGSEVGEGTAQVEDREAEFRGLRFELDVTNSLVLVTRNPAVTDANNAWPVDCLGLFERE